MDKQEEENPAVFAEDLHVIQYFGTSAEHFADTIFNECLADLVTLVPAITSFFQDLLSDEAASTDDVAASIQKFVKTFYASLEIKSEILAQYLQQVVLSIPSNKVLSDSVTHKHYRSLSCAGNSTKDSNAHDHSNMLSNSETDIASLRLAVKRAKDRKAELQKKMQCINVLQNSLAHLMQEATTYSKKTDTANFVTLLNHCCTKPK